MTSTSPNRACVIFEITKTSSLYTSAELAWAAPMSIGVSARLPVSASVAALSSPIFFFLFFLPLADFVPSPFSFHFLRPPLTLRKGRICSHTGIRPIIRPAQKSQTYRSESPPPEIKVDGEHNGISSAETNLRLGQYTAFQTHASARTFCVPYNSAPRPSLRDTNSHVYARPGQH
jgi:hypothetical protein